MLELINAVGLLSINQITSLIFGFVRSKVLAIFLGPSGLGIVSNAVTLAQSMGQIAKLGGGSGLIKLVAEYHAQNELKQLSRIIMTGIVVFGAASLLVFLAGYLFSETIAERVFGDASLSWVVLVTGATGIFIVQYQMVLNLFQGMMQWRIYVLVSVVGYLLSILVTAGLIFSAGLVGAMLSLVIAQMINWGFAFYVFRWDIKRTYPTIRLLRNWPDRDAVGQLVQFVGPLALSQLIGIVGLLFIRGEIVRQLGAEANGIYQVAWATSLAYMGLVGGAFISFGTPKVSRLLDKPGEILKLQNNQLRLGLIILAPLMVALLALREIWIPILFSRGFLSAGGLLVWQFAGDLFRTIRQTVNVSLLPLERFRYIVFENLAYMGGWGILAWALMGNLGLIGVPVGYLCVNFLVSVVALGYHTTTTGFRVFRSNAILLIKLLPLLVLGLIYAAILENLVARVLISLLLITIMLIWLPSRDELANAFSLIRKKANQFRALIKR